MADEGGRSRDSRWRQNHTSWWRNIYLILQSAHEITDTIISLQEKRLTSVITLMLQFSSPTVPAASKLQFNYHTKITTSNVHLTDYVPVLS